MPNLAPRPSLLRNVALSILLVLSTAACSPRLSSYPNSAAGTRHLIGTEEIASSSARNVLELLEGRVPQIRLPYGSTGPGTGVQGRDPNAGAPVVVLDGAITSGVDHLRSISAREVRSIRVLNGIEASQRYGRYGFNGAIVIETRSR